MAVACENIVKNVSLLWIFTRLDLKQNHRNRCKKWAIMIFYSYDTPYLFKSKPHSILSPTLNFQHVFVKNKKCLKDLLTSDIYEMLTKLKIKT